MSESADQTCTLGLWCANLNRPLGSLDEWVERVDERLDHAARAGARMLVLPELVTLSWLQLAPELDVGEQPAWLAARAAEVLPRLQDSVDARGVTLIAGSTPYRDRSSFVNRAFVLSPGATPRHHDKLELTHGERDPDAWGLGRGNEVHVHEVDGIRCAILVCLDVELTRVIARLGELDVDLVVVVAGTRNDAGYYRVFDCAKARAVELQCPVAVVGLMGVVGAERYVGGAAVYLPCEPVLGNSGVAATAGPFSADGEYEPWLVVPEVPVGTCRRIRHGVAEASAQPAGWRGSHVRGVAGS